MSNPIELAQKIMSEGPLAIALATTGTANHDRIVGVAIVTSNSEHFWQIASPLVSSPQAERIHGLVPSPDDKPFVVAWPEIFSLLHNQTVVAFNWPFVLRFLANEITSWQHTTDRPIGALPHLWTACTQDMAGRYLATRMSYEKRNSGAINTAMPKRYDVLRELGIIQRDAWPQRKGQTGLIANAVDSLDIVKAIADDVLAQDKDKSVVYSADPQYNAYIARQIAERPPRKSAEDDGHHTHEIPF